MTNRSQICQIIRKQLWGQSYISKTHINKKPLGGKSHYRITCFTYIDIRTCLILKHSTANKTVRVMLRVYCVL